MPSLNIPNAFVICWNLSGDEVCFLPEGKNGTVKVWAPVRKDEGGYFCEYKGKFFRIVH